MTFHFAVKTVQFAVMNEGRGFDNLTGPKQPHPILWVPTSYLGMGTIYMTVTFVTTILFRNLGMSEEQAALRGSALGFPYVIKFLWAPLLEMFKTKKFFVVSTQLGIGVLFALAGVALKFPSYVSITVAIFFVAGVLGATQDVAVDGVYVTALNRKEQAKYTGFQSLCWSIGPIFASGVLVNYSGVLHDGGMSWASSW